MEISGSLLKSSRLDRGAMRPCFWFKGRPNRVPGGASGQGNHRNSPIYDGSRDGESPWPPRSKKIASAASRQPRASMVGNLSGLIRDIDNMQRRVLSEGIEIR